MGQLVCIWDWGLVEEGDNIEKEVFKLESEKVGLGGLGVGGGGGGEGGSGRAILW